MARENNFDALRLFAATLVLIGHDFPIMGNKNQPVVFGTQISVYGLFIFFSISGYLISKSWKNDPHIGRFLLKRSLRIFPALAVLVLLTIFLLGPIVSQIPLAQYFSNIHTYDYLKNIGLYVTYGLPGVFYHVPVSYSVNVSIWSLPVEFFMYLVTPVVMVLFGRASPVAFAVLAAALGFAGFFLTWHYTGPQIVFYATDVRAASVTAAYFAAGAVFGSLSERFRFQLSVGAIVACAYFLVMHFAGERFGTHAAVSSIFMFSYLALLAGTKSFKIFCRVGRRGDFSYGMYLYAFPIQQSIALYFPKMAIGFAIILTAVLSLGCAAASWHFVEKIALSLKPRRSLPKAAPAGTAPTAAL